MWKHLQNRKISPREEVWVHNTCLSPPLLIEVPVPSQEEHVVLYMTVNMGMDFVSVSD